MDSALNIFYLIMAIYGWYSWKYANGLAYHEKLRITTYGLIKNLKIIALLILTSLILGFFIWQIIQVLILHI